MPAINATNATTVIAAMPSQLSEDRRRRLARLRGYSETTGKLSHAATVAGE
jgi:hypothetical protein